MTTFQLYGLAAIALLTLSTQALAEGDATKGKVAYAKCGVCHQVGPGATTLVGPELRDRRTEGRERGRLRHVFRRDEEARRGRICVE